MKQYKDYTFDDFLLDDDFRQWVREGSLSGASIWADLLTHYPEKRPVVERARKFVLAQQQSALSDQELADQVQKIMVRVTPVREQPVRQLTSRFGWWQAAAVLALVAGASLFIWRWQSESHHQPDAYSKLVNESTASLTEVVNTKATQQRIDLPDGSYVQLEPASRLSYAKTFTQQQTRTVFLQGDAFFQVAKNPKKPFLVFTNGLVTRVVGTSFSVRSSAENVSVLVRSGKVSVYSLQDAEGRVEQTKKLVLTPNQQATFQAEQNVLTQSIVADPIVIQSGSNDNSLRFNNTPISEVFSQLEQLYGILIAYDRTVMRNCYLTVVLYNEPFFTKLDVICRTTGSTYRVEGSKIVITSPGCDLHYAPNL